MEVKTEIFIKRKLAAVFFIPKENQGKEGIETVLNKAKATNIKNIQFIPKEEGEGAWADCRWSDMDGQAYFSYNLSLYYLLIIYFSQSDFLSRGQYSQQDKNLPLEKDGNLKLALTFRDACEALEPEVAYIATHLDTAEFDAIVKVVDKIEGYDADYIAGEGGLVYLRGIIADCLTDPPPEYAPDTMPIDEGILVFGGRGSKRWW